MIDASSSDQAPAGADPLDAALHAVLTDRAAVAVASAASAARLSTGHRHAERDPTLDPASLVTRWTGAMAAAPEGPHEVVALLPDDLAAAGPSHEALLAAATRRLRAGGRLVVAAHAWHRLGGQASVALTGRELADALGHAGLTVTDACAPGAAALLGGRTPTFDEHADRTPGLRDAAATVLAVGRRWHDRTEREAAFFGTLPRKVVAGAVLCRDDQGRVLCVHDSFKGRWTIPGGVVDADERPDAGAAREAREESGIPVRIDRLLGVFGASWPDRLVFVFAAEPEGPAEAPAHLHEITDVAWLPLDEALARFAPHTAEQVRRSLEHPGGVWQQTIA